MGETICIASSPVRSGRRPGTSSRDRTKAAGTPRIRVATVAVRATLKLLRRYQGTSVRRSTNR